MYMVTTAASSSQTWLSVDAAKAWAAPWNWQRRDEGSSREARVSSTAFTAAPRDEPSATLKEMVATGNWPCRMVAGRAERSSMRTRAESGMGLPSLPLT